MVDTLGAGLDEMVLICQGSSARLTPETEKLPIDAVVIGLVDTRRRRRQDDLLEPRRSDEPSLTSRRRRHGDPSRRTLTPLEHGGACHANDRRSDPQRGPAGPHPDGRRGVARRRTASGRRAVGRPRRLPDGRRRGRGGRGGVPGIPRPAARRPQEGRRVHPHDLRRAGRGARPDGARGDEDRPARPQDRQAPRRDPAWSRASSTSGPTTSRATTGSR